MTHREILDRIDSLVAQEHTLRSRVQAGELPPAEEQRAIRQLDAAIDQCWDLLRRRHAARSYGHDPDNVRPRPIPAVEDYLQ